MKAAGEPEEVMRHLLDAIETLLTAYGVSAKRTVGWGTAEIKKWRAWREDTPADQPIAADNRKDFVDTLVANSGGAP
ncbi:MAG: hypothetical protein KatS3mg082_3278 [Nitrospiraceae bacterium]|nr:MAG: hypothetical protein KatS3mg082_3278 [Nitrospiraceae bacterium]